MAPLTSLRRRGKGDIKSERACSVGVHHTRKPKEAGELTVHKRCLKNKEELGKCRNCECYDSQLPERLDDGQLVQVTLCFDCFLEDSSVVSREFKVRERIVATLLKDVPGINNFRQFKNWVLRYSPDDKLRRAKRLKI